MMEQDQLDHLCALVQHGLFSKVCLMYFKDFCDLGDRIYFRNELGT